MPQISLHACEFGQNMIQKNISIEIENCWSNGPFELKYWKNKITQFHKSYGKI